MSSAQKPDFSKEPPPPPYSEHYTTPPPPFASLGPPPPPPGWPQSQQGSYPYPPPNYGSTGHNHSNAVIAEPVLFPASQVIIVGGCPVCRVGVLEDSFSCLGLLCALVFFPIGILCCLALKDKRCTNCGAIF